MATTTNFGWETPDDTDLVKDGALAIRTLGSAIDTSLVDLKGGTTGQVLSKTSNTDMDFTWVTSDDANAIQNAIVDAKGDLIAASAADTPARLAVGNNGETLVADSSASTGLRWQPNQSMNMLHNSAFDIWQRGTSFSITNSTSLYTADRWQTYRGTTGATLSRQVADSLGTTPAQYVKYCARVQRDSGNSATDIPYLLQNYENADTAPYIGKTVTLSFYARKGANFSGASSEMSAAIVTGTDTTDKNQLNWTGYAVTQTNNFVLTTSWQRFSMTATLGTSITQVGTRFFFTPVGTAGAADYFEITGVKLEVGSVATNYCRSSATLAGELAACQRYFSKSYDLGTAPGASTNNGSIYSGLNAVGTTTGWLGAMLQYPVRMRVAPTVTTYDYAYASGKVSRVTPGGTDQNGLTPITALAAEGSVAIQSSSGNAHAGIGFQWTASAEL